MKTKFLLLFASLFLITSALTAQNRQRTTPEERAKKQTETLTEKLTLNDDQKKQVQEITLKFAKERTTQMSSEATGSREERMEQFQKIQKQQDDAIKAVLTDEQKKKYDEYQKEQREQQNRRRGEGRQR